MRMRNFKNWQNVSKCDWRSSSSNVGNSPDHSFLDWEKLVQFLTWFVIIVAFSLKPTLGSWGTKTANFLCHIWCVNFGRILKLNLWWLKDLRQLWREPWYSGYGRRLVFWRQWVRFPAPYTGWTLLTLIIAKILKLVWKRTIIKENHFYNIYNERISQFTNCKSYIF